MTAVSQAEFARQQRMNRSSITRFKQAGRLVMTDDGMVDVEASLQRMEATKDPNRDDVRNRHAGARPAAGNQQPIPADQTAIGNSYQTARAVKEKFFAMMAKLDYERASGKMVERVELESAVADVAFAFRSSLENMPHRTAALLVGKDIDAIRATLKQEIHTILTEMERDFAARLKRLSSEEMAA